jgi:CRISPR/Cas system-associated exonuclease Cas4 (RecB family)
MRTIRASEIGTYLYCKRAWWFALRGIKSENQTLLASGQELHERHGRSQVALGCLQIVAYALLLLAFMMLTIYLIWLWI